MENKGKDYMEIDLLQLAKALWHRAWAILLAMLVCGAAGFGYATYLVTPLYRAETMMYVNNSSFSVGSTSFSISSSELTAAQSLVETYIVILNTRTTLEDVIADAELEYSYEELLEMIDAHAVNNTEVFSITVTSESPQEAELIANTIARILPDKISSIVEGSSVRVVDYAVIPSHKYSPSISRYTMLGALLGIVISCGYIVLRELFDDQIRDEDFLMQTYNLPVLATIPELLSSKGGSGYYNSQGYGKTSGEGRA